MASSNTLTEDKNNIFKYLTVVNVTEPKYL